MKKSFIFIFAIILLSSISYAGNVDTFGIGSKATSLGGAFTAYADDPYAVYYNPAGLTQINSSTLSLGLLVLDPRLQVHDFKAKNGNGTAVPGDSNFVDTSDTLIIPHIGYAMPIGSKLTLGIAAYVPYGLDIKWSEDYANNAGAYNSTHSYYIREVVTPTLAYKINDKLSIGAGISLGKSKSGVERTIYNDANIATLNAATSNGTNCAGSLAAYCQQLAVAKATNGKIIKTELEDDFNWSYNVGIMYKPVDVLTLGLTYRSRTSTDFEGDTQIEGVTIPGLNTNVGATTSVDHPEQIALGVRYAPTNKVSLELDVVWTNWSIIDGYTVNFDPYLTNTRATENYSRKWKDTRQFRLGIEYKATDIITLRGGYFYDPSPIPDDTFDLVWPDADKKTYSIGAGFNFGRITLDTVVQYSVAESKRYIGGESEELNASYANSATKTPGTVEMSADGHLWGLGATISYKF